MIDSSNDRMVDSSIGRMSNDRIIDLSNDRIIDLSNDRIIDLSNDRIIDLSNDRMIDLSNDRICLIISDFELRNRFLLSFNSQQSLYSLISRYLYRCIYTYMSHVYPLVRPYTVTSPRAANWYLTVIAS